MKKSVKTLVVITYFFSFFLSANAQLKLPVLSAVATDIKKVIGDYPIRFINLMGEIIEEHPQSTDYQCNFKVNGAENFLSPVTPRKKKCAASRP